MGAIPPPGMVQLLWGSASGSNAQEASYSKPCQPLCWKRGGRNLLFFLTLLTGICLCFSGAGESGKSTIVKQMK